MNRHQLYLHVMNSDTAHLACYSISLMDGGKEVYAETRGLHEVDETYDLGKKFVEVSVKGLSKVDSREIKSLDVVTRSQFVKSFLTHQADFIKDNSGVEILVNSLKSNRNNTKSRSLKNERLKVVIKRCEEFRRFYCRRDELDLFNKKKSIIYVTSDASFDEVSKCAAWSCVVRSPEETLRYSGICPRSVTSSSQAETYAALKGLSICNESAEFHNVLLSSDHEGMIRCKGDGAIYKLAKKNGVTFNFKAKWIKRNSTKDHKWCDGIAKSTMRKFRNGMRKDISFDNRVSLNLKCYKLK